MTSTDPIRIQFLSWNILTSPYCTPKILPRNNPDDLHPKIRYTRILEYIEQQINDSNGSVVIGLQEVELKFYSRITPILSRWNYDWEFQSFFQKKSGRMGVLLAWSRNHYILIESKRIKVSDWLDDQCPFPSNEIWRSQSWTETIMHKFRTWMGWKSIPTTQNWWKTALQRPNWLLMAKLGLRSNSESISSSTRITVAAYHMPCLFWMPEAIALHIGAMSTLVTKFSRNTPLVLMTDANTKPNDTYYSWIVHDRENDDKPKEINRTWYPAFGEKLYSLYSWQHGSDPKFTTNVHGSFSGVPFKDCIDYVLTNVEPYSVNMPVVPPSNYEGELIPSADHPSDHFPLTGRVEFLKQPE